MKACLNNLAMYVVGSACVLPLACLAATINFDVDKVGSVDTYSGVGVAPDSGTVWNSLAVVQAGSGDVTIGDAVDSFGIATGVSLVMNRNGGEELKVYVDASAGNPNPSALMSDYTYWGGWVCALSGLEAGTYDLYCFGHGNNVGDVNTFILDAANGGDSATTTDYGDWRDIFQANAEGNSYVKLTGTVDGSGTLVFSGFDNLNGFQLQLVASVPEAPIIEDLNDQTVLAGASIVLTPTVIGIPEPTCQWHSNAVVMIGETNTTLALNNIQAGQDGTVYSLVAGNAAGTVTNGMTLTVLQTSGQLPAFPGADGAGGYTSGGRGGIVYHVTKLNSALDDPDRATPGTLLYGLNDSNFPDEPRTIVFDVAGVFHLGMGDRPDWDSMGNAWDSQSRQSISATDLTIAGQTAPGPVIIMGGTLKPSGSNIVIRNITIAAGFGMKAFWEPPPKTPPMEGTLPTSYTMDAIDVSGQNIMIDHIDALYCTDEAISCNENADNLTVQYSTSARGQNYNGHAYGHLLQPNTDNKLSYLHNLDAHFKSRLPRVGSEVGTGALNDFRNNVTYNWFGSAPGYTGSGQYSKNNFIHNFYLAGPGGDSSWNSTSAGGTGIFNGTSAAYTFLYPFGNLRDINVDSDPYDTASADGLYFNSAIQAAAYDVDIGVTLPAVESFTNVLRHVGSRWWERDYDFAAGNTNAIDTPNERLIHEVATGTGRIEAWADDPFDSDPAEGVEWRSLWALRMDTNGAAPFNRPAGWDTDSDGMPDDWETGHGLNPGVANNNGDFDGDGYTDLEEYLNEIAAWPAPGVISFIGASNSRYAEIANWLVNGVALNISGKGLATTYSKWQPSRYDSVLIKDQTCVVDAVGQHAGTLVLETNATLHITNGWLKVAHAVEIGPGCDVTVTSAGSMLVTNDIVNNGTLRLTGSSGLTVGGSIINNGVLDIMTWSGTLPGIVNNGVVLDFSQVKVDAVAVDGADIVVSIQGYAGHNYQLQYRDDLLSGTWIDIGAAAVGNDEPIELSHTGGATVQSRVYRVAVSP